AHWTTDRPSKSTAFYEEAVKRNSTMLGMFDTPDTRDDIADELFNLVSQSTEALSHFHAETYLVHGMDVLFRADIDIEWSFEGNKGRTSSGARQPTSTTITIEGTKANALKPEHRACLQYQFPEVDWLPGPQIAAPVAVGDFDLVPILELADWDKKGEKERYAEVAKLGAAE